MRDIEDPFEQLTRCHRRLEERLASLTEAASSADPYDAVRDAVGFFGRAIVRHEADEEQSLFPRLAALAEMTPLMAKLAEEHLEHQKLHRRLEDILVAIEEGAVPGDELREIASQLEAAYRTHLDEEDKVLFPAARAALAESALADIAREMEDRRRGGRAGA